MRTALPSDTPNLMPVCCSVALVSLVSYACLLVVGVADIAGAEEAPLEAPSPAEIHEGIVKSIQSQFKACNEENMKGLLAVMSQKMPDRERFVFEVDACFSGRDSYNILEEVEILDDSDAPGSEFEYPYATARVTQTVLELLAADPRTPVFLRKCRKGDRDPREIAEQLGVLSDAATTSVEVLFRHEDGEWKLVNGLTAPVLAGEDAGKRRETGIGVPAFRHIHVSGSAFK